MHARHTRDAQDWQDPINTQLVPSTPGSATKPTVEAKWMCTTGRGFRGEIEIELYIQVGGGSEPGGGVRATEGHLGRPSGGAAALGRA